VDKPRRLRKRGHKFQNAISIDSKFWGCPFRVRESSGRWYVVWVGDEMGLADHRPANWKDIPGIDRRWTATLALTTFEKWLLDPAQRPCLERAKAALAGYNLRCYCPLDYPCHGDILLRVCNERKDP
jgi:hypothetical protein